MVVSATCCTATDEERRSSERKQQEAIVAIAEKPRQVKSVTREELKAKIDRNDPLTLVEALSSEHFRHAHLPGAVNVPPDRVDELASALLPDKQREVVVYCANAACHASGDVARRLTALGYTSVGHYAGGKADWVAARLPVEPD